MKNALKLLLAAGVIAGVLLDHLAPEALLSLVTLVFESPFKADA